MKPDLQSTLHRYFDQVALSFESVNHTIYIEPAHAEWLGNQLLAAVRDIRSCKFAESPFVTVTWPTPSSYQTELLVVAVSDNTNSFGLSGVVVIDREGNAWRLGINLHSPPRPEFRPGWVIPAMLTSTGDIVPSSFPVTFEIPERLPKMPDELKKQEWDKAGKITLSVRDILPSASKKDFSDLTVQDFVIPMDKLRKLQEITFVAGEFSKKLKNRQGDAS